jgi:hypothetical protein
VHRGLPDVSQGAQVMAFYSLAPDANDFLKVSEIEITDSDALLMASMGIERTRRERDHGAVCQFHHVDSLSFLNPRYEYQWNKPQSKCRKKIEVLKTPQFAFAKIPTQMTPRCIQPTGILYARRYLRPNSADATQDRAPVILRQSPKRYPHLLRWALAH